VIDALADLLLDLADQQEPGDHHGSVDQDHEAVVPRDR
jgi:hypothetical protein